MDKFTINKLISIYEILEEKFLYSISERYINKQFKLEGFSKTFETFLDNFYENESKRELKNNTLISFKKYHIPSSFIMVYFNPNK